MKQLKSGPGFSLWFHEPFWSHFGSFFDPCGFQGKDPAERQLGFGVPRGQRWNGDMRRAKPSRGSHGPELEGAEGASPCHSESGMDFFPDRKEKRTRSPGFALRVPWAPVKVGTKADFLTLARFVKTPQGLSNKNKHKCLKHTCTYNQLYTYIYIYI